MIEMSLEGQGLEQQSWQWIGESWIQAVTSGTLDQIAGLCYPEVTSILLTPKRAITLDNARDLVSKFYDWFGECTSIQLQESRTGLVGERLAVSYRLMVQEQGDWFEIEQKLHATLRAGRIGQLQLLCSGFQPLMSAGKDTEMPESGAAGKDPAPADLLEVFVAGSESASTCALLTPLIRARLRGMQSGQVLEVRVDDPAAQADVEAWARLSGNPLLDASLDREGLLRLFIQKK